MQKIKQKYKDEKAWGKGKGLMEDVPVQQNADHNPCYVLCHSGLRHKSWRQEC